MRKLLFPIVMSLGVLPLGAYAHGCIDEKAPQATFSNELAEQRVHVLLHAPLVFVRPVSTGLQSRFLIRLRNHRCLA
jgi:hypothetical protein